MNNSRIAIRILFAVAFMYAVALVFDLDYFNPERIDVYLFFEHKRFVIHIVEDLIEKIALSALTYGILILIPHPEPKRYARCFFWVSIAAIPYYFLFYSQYATQVLLPALIISLVSSLIYTRWKNEKRSNVR